PGARRAFHLGRGLSYGLAGAVAAASAGTLAGWAQASRSLLAIWVLVHAGLLVLGAFLLVRGRMPALPAGVAWRLGRPLPASPALASGWQPMRGPRSRAGLAGLAWVAWPCAALQGALVVAAMASTPLQGFLAMAAFALSSSAGLWLAPYLWR